MTKRKLQLLLYFILFVAFDVFLLFYPPGSLCLDSRLTYTFNDLQTLFQDLGPKGLEQYFTHELVDLGFLTFYTWLILKAARALSNSGRLRLSPAVYLLCIAPGAFDFVETSGILLLIRAWPNVNPTLASIVRWSTPLKWTSAALLLTFLAFRARPQTRA